MKKNVNHPFVRFELSMHPHDTDYIRRLLQLFGIKYVEVEGFALNIDAQVENLDILCFWDDKISTLSDARDFLTINGVNVYPDEIQIENAYDSFLGEYPIIGGYFNSVSYIYGNIPNPDDYIHKTFECVKEW